MSAKVKDILLLDGANAGYDWLFTPYGKIRHAPWSAREKILQRELKTFKMVVFTGGADVEPGRYGEQQGPNTVCNPVRDEYEFDIAERARKMNIPMVGVCRGAQLGCVFSGGRLIQHRIGHTGSTATRHHAYVVPSKEVRTQGDPVLDFSVSSDHHQFMIPQPAPEHTVLVRAFDNTTEVAWFPHTKFLCVQYHPEWMGLDSDAVRIFHALIRDFSLNEGNNTLKLTCQNIRQFRRNKDEKKATPSLPAPANDTKPVTPEADPNRPEVTPWRF